MPNSVRTQDSHKQVSHCPECGGEFTPSQRDSIEPHWRAEHEDVMPFRQAWPLLRDSIYMPYPYSKPARQSAPSRRWAWRQSAGWGVAKV